MHAPLPPESSSSTSTTPPAASRGTFRVRLNEPPRRLLRIEQRNAEYPIEKKPSWIRTTAHTGPRFHALKGLVHDHQVNTVCQEAGCPNVYECWEDREATFLIGGSRCTRRCDFCQIDTGKPEPLDREEPHRVAESVQQLGLRYATITGVTRDDLDDEGAWLYAETVRAIHRMNPHTGVENLVPDFHARPSLLDIVFEARPQVLAHNIETVPRILRRIRPAFRYDTSLSVIRAAHDSGLITKSNLILGMGERPEEVEDALDDLKESGCDIVTITQYLRPSRLHHPVDRWVTPEEFLSHATLARDMGFAGVMAGPLVRSSYRAGALYGEAMTALGRPLPPGMEELARPHRAQQEIHSLIHRLL